MQLSEDETIEKYAKRCDRCNKKTLPPYEYEWTCISSGYNVIKRKHELTKIQNEKLILTTVEKMLNTNCFVLV